MNYRRANQWKKTALWGTIGFAFTWIISGGLVVEHTYRIEPLPYGCGGPDIGVEIVNRPAFAGVPLVVWYNTDRGRLSVRVTYVTHNYSLADPEIIRDWCNLTLPDGGVIDLTRQVRAGWNPQPWLHEYWTVTTNRFRSVPSLKSEVTVDDCLPPDTPFDLRVKGRLCSGGKVIEEIDETQSHQPHKRTKVRVLWQWLTFTDQ